MLKTQTLQILASKYTLKLLDDVKKPKRFLKLTDKLLLFEKEKSDFEKRIPLTTN